MDKDNWTVLDDFGEQSHRDIAALLLPKLKEDMTEQEWDEFAIEVKQVVIETILRDLEVNLATAADWPTMQFTEPQDFLNAKDMANVIKTEARSYWENDQIGKSNDIMKVIFDEAEDRGIIERETESGGD